MSPQLEKPLQVWHLVLGLAISILGGFFTAGASYAGVTGDIERLKVKAAQVEDQAGRLIRIEEKQSQTAESLEEIKSDLKEIAKAIK